MYHIDVPPNIVPLNYTNQNKTYAWNRIVTLLENTGVVLTYTINDTDTAPANLTSYVAGLPYEGDLYQIVETSDGEWIQGDIINATMTEVPPLSDGLYHLIYIPTFNLAGVNYATFTLIAYDQIFQSDRFTSRLSVKHINEAPYINMTRYDWNTTAGDPFVITGITVTDPDAGYLPIEFVLTVPSVSVNGTLLAPQSANASMNLTNFDPAYCVASEQNVSCVNGHVSNLLFLFFLICADHLYCRSAGTE